MLVAKIITFGGGTPRVFSQLRLMSLKTAVILNNHGRGWSARSGTNFTKVGVSCYLSHFPVLRATRFCSTSVNGTCKFHVLENRSILKIWGSDTIDYLQGMLTNDVRHFYTEEQSAEASFHMTERVSTMYNLMLDQRGRVLYDLLLYDITPPDEPTKLLIECDRGGAGKLLKRLKMYILRKQVKVELVKDLVSMAVLNCSQDKISETLRSAGINFILSEPDPRLHLLGHRVICDQANVSDFAADNIGTFDDYTAHRVALGVPEGIQELPVGQCLPLESNGDYMNGVSFHKGCYIGQELTARTHHTGVVRKRIMPMTVLTEDATLRKQLTPGMKLINDAGKTLGKLRYAHGKTALGLVRIKEGLAAAKIMVQLPDDKFVEFEAWKPDWWSDLEVRGFQPSAAENE